MSNEQKAEELLQSKKDQTRTNTEPTTVSESQDVQDAIQSAYADILDGDASSNTTVRDENLTALLRGLDSAGELGDVMASANEELGRDHNDASVSRSQAMALLARVGLLAVDSSLVETAVDARNEYEKSKPTEF